MTIYFAGNEPDAITGNNWQAGAGTYDSAYNRGSWKVGPASPSCGLSCLSEAAGDTAGGWWIHTKIVCDGGFTNRYISGNNFLLVRNSATDLALQIAATSTSNLRCTLYGTDGTTTTVDLGSVFQNSTSTTLDISVFTDAVLGACLRVYLGGSLAVSVNFAGKTARNLKTVSYGVFAAYSTSGYFCASEFIVSDIDTRYMRYGTYYPSADGTHTDGTGTYADIDESGATDVNSIILAAAADRQSWSVTKHGAHGGGAITAVIINGLIASDGTNDMQASIRIGGVDYDSADLGLTAAAEGKSVVFNTRPDTSTGWGTTDITALEFGYEAVAP